MSLTAHITTPDGAEHPNAVAAIYPLTLQTIPGDMEVRMMLHCWHSAASRQAGASELSGYPAEVRIAGEQAQIAIVTGLASLATLQWTQDPATNAGMAEAAIIAAMEEAVIQQFPAFVQA
jgi:hypothetical protein